MAMLLRMCHSFVILSKYDRNICYVCAVALPLEHSGATNAACPHLVGLLPSLATMRNIPRASRAFNTFYPIVINL